MPYTIAELNTQKQSRKKNGKKVKTKKLNSLLLDIKNRKTLISQQKAQKQSRKKNGKKVKTKKQSKKELNDQWVRCFRCNPWNGECKKCKKNKNYYVKK